MSETVLVTGGTGFIAGWCIVALLKQGFEVRTTVRDQAKEAAVRSTVASGGAPGDHLTVVVADLTQDDGWTTAMNGCAYVLHVASPLGTGSPGHPDAFLTPARDGTLRVLQAAVAAGVRRVVMTSAAAAARPPLATQQVSNETIWADPKDPQFDAYRISKIVAERAAWDFMAIGGGTTELTTVLPGAVFGPLLRAGNVGSTKIIADLLAGRPRALPRLGFWVVDVRDLAEAHIRAMLSPGAAGQRFIAAAAFMWMEEIAATLRAELGARAANVPTRRLPSFMVRLLLPFQPELKTLAPLIGRRFALTTEKARMILGFAPRHATETIVDCAESLLSVKARLTL